MSNITEKQIENQILSYLQNKGIFSFKIQTTGVFDPTKGAFRKRPKHHIKGVSDILGCLSEGEKGIFPGRFLAIEVKKPYVSKKTGLISYRTQEQLEKMASPEQVEFINKIKSLGGIAFYADSVEIVEDQLLLFGVL